MSMSPQARLAAFTRTMILSATPAQLVTMLYDRLLLDLRRALAAQEEGRWAAASAELLHAQAILTELATSLDQDAWEGAPGLFALYDYARTLLVSANVARDDTQTRTVIELMEPLCATWHEAAAQASTAAPLATAGIGVVA